jgi:hypothetical protein
VVGFKKGDKVICIIGGNDGFPVEGKVYTVTDETNTYSTLIRVGRSKDYWHISRFVFATPLLEALS